MFQSSVHQPALDVCKRTWLQCCYASLTIKHHSNLCSNTDPSHCSTETSHCPTDNGHCPTDTGHCPTDTSHCPTDTGHYPTALLILLCYGAATWLLKHLLNSNLCQKYFFNIEQLVDVRIRKIQSLIFLLFSSGFFFSSFCRLKLPPYLYFVALLNTVDRLAFKKTE